MVLNRNYDPFPGTPQQALDATTAHEFNHSIQFGYGALTGANAPDDSFVEGGATWMEDEVFDMSNDNYNYLWPDFNICMGQYTPLPYRYWITFRGLTERYGTGMASGGEQVMQDFWELTSQSASSNMLSALNTALVNKGTNLADAYHAYAIAVKFNKQCGGGYVYPYCFEEGADYVSTKGATPLDGNINTVGNSYNGNIADNYSLNWIQLPTSGGPYPVTLQNTSSGGQLRGSVVCHTGSALNISPLPATVGPGSSTSLSNFNPAGCNSVVAVVTNQAQTASNPASCPARSFVLETSGNPPTPPDLLVAVPISQNQITVSWQDNSNNETSFRIERSLNGTTDWAQIATVGANVTTYANIGLTCSTIYHYRVQAYNISGNSDYSNTANATTSPCDIRVYLPIIIASGGNDSNIFVPLSRP